MSSNSSERKQANRQNRRNKTRRKNKPLICSLHGDIDTLCDKIDEHLKKINSKTPKGHILKIKQQVRREVAKIKKNSKSGP